MPNNAINPDVMASVERPLSGNSCAASSDRCRRLTAMINEGAAGFP